jgi:sugar O-acyltransferase (sialic acid O-acetyltransferase NeuD family)
MKKTFIIGAGNLGREVYALMCELNKNSIINEVVGFIVDDFKYGKTVEGIEVFPFEKLNSIDVNAFHFLIAIGDSKGLRKVYDKLAIYRITNWLTVIHPTAYVSMNVTIGDGCYVGPNTTISIGSLIGDFCMINQNCSIGHDVVLGSFSVVSPGCVLSGRTECDEGVFLGSGVITLPNVSIGKNSIISANTVINRDIGENLKVGPVIRNMEIPI